MRLISVVIREESVKSLDRLDAVDQQRSIENTDQETGVANPSMK